MTKKYQKFIDFVCICVFLLKQQDDSGGTLSEFIGSHAIFKFKVCIKMYEFQDAQPHNTEIHYTITTKQHCL